MDCGPLEGVGARNDDGYGALWMPSKVFEAKPYVAKRSIAVSKP